LIQQDGKGRWNQQDHKVLKVQQVTKEDKVQQDRKVLKEQ
jgi:hypothetical protein